MTTPQEQQAQLDKAKSTLLDMQSKLANGSSPQNITSTTLQPQTPIAYSTPDYSPPPSIEGLTPSYATPPLAPTPQETNASDMSKRLQDLNTTLSGKAAYQTEQNAAAGIDTLTAQQNDLTAQLNSLTNEAKAIPLQMQQDATGRGITSGGLAPLQTARLRTNAIQALGISSLLDTTKGLLASAQDKANRAVAAKYDPIQAQIDAATKNLALIQNSPDYTLAEKNRAQAQLDIQKQKQATLDKNKADSATIMSWAAAALKNGATPLQAQAISNLGTSDNPDLNAAFQLYAPFAVDPNATQKAVLDLQAQRLQNELATTKNPLEIQQLKAQINLTNKQAQKAAADAKSAIVDATVNNLDMSTIASHISNPNQEQSSLFGLTLNGLLQKAKVYMTTNGNITGLGLSGKGDIAAQRKLIMNYAGYLADQAGLDVPQITAFYKANAKAAGEVISRIAKIDTTTQTLAGQFPRLAQLATKVGNLGITESDLTAGKANVARKFGSVDAGNYVELLQTIRGDYSAMQAAIGGSRGGQFFSQTAQEAIPLGLTPEQYTGLADTIRQSAAIATQASGDEAKKLIGTTSSTGNGDATSSLQSDIQSAASASDYGTREQLISKLVSLYPELTKDQIASLVYQQIPDKK